MSHEKMGPLSEQESTPEKILEKVAFKMATSLGDYARKQSIPFDAATAARYLFGLDTRLPGYSLVIQGLDHAVSNTLSRQFDDLEETSDAKVAFMDLACPDEYAGLFIMRAPLEAIQRYRLIEWRADALLSKMVSREEPYHSLCRNMAASIAATLNHYGIPIPKSLFFFFRKGEEHTAPGPIWDFDRVAGNDFAAAMAKLFQRDIFQDLVKSGVDPKLAERNAAIGGDDIFQALNEVGNEAEERSQEAAENFKKLTTEFPNMQAFFDILFEFTADGKLPPMSKEEAG